MACFPRKRVPSGHTSPRTTYWQSSVTWLMRKIIARVNSLSSSDNALPSRCTHEVSAGPWHGGKKNTEANAHDVCNPDALPKEAMVSRYEEVRSNVTGRPCRGVLEAQGQGLALMLHQGMAAWLRAWLRAWLKAAVAPVAKPAKHLPRGCPTDDEQVTAQIISIIATMALTTSETGSKL